MRTKRRIRAWPSWQAHRVTFGKPISNELVFELNFLTASSRDATFKEMVFLLSKVGMTKSAISDFHEERLALSKFNIAAVVLSEEVTAIVRRELRRAFPKVNPSVELLQKLLQEEVLKRGVRGRR